MSLLLFRVAKVFFFFLYSLISINTFSFSEELNHVIKNKIELSEKESVWLRKQKTITFAGDPNWLPFEAFNEQGEYIGIVADYLGHIEEFLPIKFQPIKTKDWSDTISHAKVGDIDIISDDINSKPLQEHYNPIPAYIKSPIVIVMKESTGFVDDLQSIYNQKIALITDYGYNDNIKKAYPHIKFSYEENADIALESLSNSKIDAVLLSMPKAQYLLSVEGYTNLKIVGKTKVTLNLTLFVKKGKPHLFSALKKTMKEITNTHHLDIISSWRKIKFAKETDYILLYQLLGLFIFFIFGTLFWYKKLNNEVKKRKESEAQISMLIDNIPLNVIVSGFDGSVLRANHFALKTFDISSEDLAKYNVMDFYSDPIERDNIISMIQTNGKVNDRIIKFRRLDKSEMSIMISIIPILYDGKKALLSIMVDLTERIEMEEGLRMSKKIADNANRSKSEFLANMSHEIRTPMNAIIGFTELLDEQVTKPRLKSYTKIIKNASHSLLTLINDILDLSKIEAGKLEITRTAVNVNDIVNDVASIFSMTVGNKGLSIVLDIDESIPKSLLLDGIRLRQVLVNLVGNAVKFTDEGYIKLSIHAFNVDDHLSKLDLEISIEDTGIGISQDQRENIFLSFEQQEGQDNRKFGGTGLGLSISKRLVEMMDGTIMVQSTEKKGATFFIYLYGVDISSIQINEDEKIQKDMNKIIFKPAKILIVDDIEDNRELIVKNFEDTDIEIVTASDGIEAISQLEKENPDLILMDIRMPNMDGYEATRKIREMGNAVPIVALTASVMKDEYEQAKSQDFNGYLRKPILRNDLFSALSDYLAYESIDTVEMNHPKDIFTLDDLAIQNSTKILETLDTVIMPLHEKAVLNNSISDIEEFSVKVYALAQLYKIVPLEEYVMHLNKAVDSFDIIQMQYLLREFTSLNKKFHLL